MVLEKLTPPQALEGTLDRSKIISAFCPSGHSSEVSTQVEAAQPANLNIPAGEVGTMASPLLNGALCREAHRPGLLQPQEKPAAGMKLRQGNSRENGPRALMPP